MSTDKVELIITPQQQQQQQQQTVGICLLLGATKYHGRVQFNPGVEDEQTYSKNLSLEKTRDQWISRI